jgi:hypothetical protein
VHPPSLSRKMGQPPVLASSNRISTLHQRFACARLSQSCLPESCSGFFPQRSPPWLLTTAACGGLRSAPDCRPRRALLHLSYSYTSPCGNICKASSANGLRQHALPCDTLLGRCHQKTLAANGYALYVKFRPGVPTGVKGWGARGKLDLTLIRRLTKPSRSRH